MFSEAHILYKLSTTYKQTEQDGLKLWHVALTQTEAYDAAAMGALFPRLVGVLEHGFEHVKVRAMARSIMIFPFFLLTACGHGFDRSITWIVRLKIQHDTIQN